MVRVEKWEKKEEDQVMTEKMEEDKEGRERGRKEKKGGAGTRSSTPGTTKWGASDVRCKEVKSENSPETPKKPHDN